MVIKHLKEHDNKLDFESTEHVKEASGFTLSEKNVLYEILINYGVPVTEENKDDWEFLKIIMARHCKGEDADVNVGNESIKVLEKFVS